jgi:phage tail-like protein
MADPDMRTPFAAFNFSVEITVPGMTSGSSEASGKPQFVCNATFSECDGLEMSMESKTIREGGNNQSPIHLTGPVSYGQLTLKRGMTADFHLWEWFDRVMQRGNAGLRASGQVVMLSRDHEELVIFNLEGCLPVKVKAPTLSASDGAVAIEELQIAYELLHISRPQQEEG